MAETAVAEANAALAAMAEITQIPTLRIRQITAGLTEELRHLVLWPDKPLDSSYVRLDEDKHGYHFGAFVPSQDKPAAVISVFFEPIPPVGGTACSGNHETSARFRKFACHPEFQGQGIGTSLLRYAASYCSSKGATVFWCDARLSSSQWYEKRGLVPFGDAFFKATVEHIRMKMVLMDREAEGQLGSHRKVVP